VIGSRTEAAVLTALGLAVMVSSVWFRHVAVLLVGIFIVGFGSSALYTALRRSPQQRAQEQQIRRLWEIAYRIPSDVALRDPVTGKQISVERHRGFLSARRGFLTLVVADPLGELEDKRAATATRYMLGYGAAPVPPPLFQHHGPADEPVPAGMTWRQAGRLLRFNDATGAMETSTAELGQLRALVDRAVADTTGAY
jgi:hypothetical protein